MYDRQNYTLEHIVIHYLFEKILHNLLFFFISEKIQRFFCLWHADCRYNESYRKIPTISRRGDLSVRPFDQGFSFNIQRRT